MAGTRTLLGIALSLVTTAGGCGDDGGQDATGCTPGAPQACQCPDGTASTHTCLPDGSGFGVCSCGAGTGTDTATGSGGTATDGADGTAGIVCGDMIQNIGECDEMSDNYCPEDCPEDTGGSGSSSDGPSACDDAPIFSLMIANQPSVWTDGGLNGIMAGHNMCAAMGADHVCSYAEVVAAADKNEFAGMAAGTTAWLHRLTPATIDDVTYAPGVGGRCLDWTLDTNDTADGEYVTFNGGVPTFTLDDDTNYDAAAPAPNPHVQMGLLECGGTQRAILCCHPECVP